MLYLISLGLYDQKDMSVKALETARKCDKLYLELYTTRMNTDADRLTNFIGKYVKQLTREETENCETIIKEAKTKVVGILVGGDALVATTHTSIMLDAKKAGVDVHVIHGSSIYSAIGETGLQLYKFGKTTTLTYHEKNYKPTSFYETIQGNKKSGMHTLVLLDIKSDQNRYMTIREGLELLLETEKEKKLGIISQNAYVIAVSQLGGDQHIRYGKVKDLMKAKLLENTPAVLVIPGDLHFMEKEFLEDLYM